MEDDLESSSDPSLGLDNIYPYNPYERDKTKGDYTKHGKGKI